jgi:hypothetical protein
MYKQPLQRRHTFCLLLAVSLLLNGLTPCVAVAQKKERKPVVISFGQPNIWSLEQAHYLLARMHMVNQELQAKALGADDLDPNRINGTRIQILKQLFGLSAEFDQGIGFQNRRIVENDRFNDSRRRELVTRRSSLQDKSLALTHEISDLETERARMNTDKSATDDQKALKDAEIASKKKEQDAIKEQITSDSDEIKSLGPEPSGTPTSPTPSASPFNKDSLPTSILDDLVKDNAKKLLDAAQDPKLNASTMLDNTVQLQYEIIAKQLTLLRDEVGPGERLVFLELPQSIYTSPGDGDEKMAQTWWHVNGYTRTDPLVRSLLELFEVEQKWHNIQQVKAYQDRKDRIEAIKCDARDKDEAIQQKLKDDPIEDIFVGLKCERESARKSVLTKLYREANSLFSRVEQNGARDTSDMVDAVRRVVGVRNMTKGTDSDGKRVNAEVEIKGLPGTEGLASATSAQQMEANRREKIEEIRDRLLKILSEDKPLEATDAQALKNEFKIKDGSEFEKGIEFIRLDEESALSNGVDANIERRTVRTVDIIPRQSSLNVNDINETVKATGILAAFKFLFGFAGQVNFQRQREQFEQFIHQELYASGFGKGNRDFGWTFGALPGTKRVAPGVRTTYAALVVPDDAESIVLSARGCYFPRKSYQPLDFEDTGHIDWARDNKFSRYNCGDEQTYILPIPGGGETSNFWVTNVDYQPAEKGDFVTVSVRGNNFSSQMGVLVNGTPLFPTVGLGQPSLMPKKAAADGTTTPQTTVPSDCTGVTGICGRYERIDPKQIVFSFRMSDTFEGTPTITLIAPGKSVDLNMLHNLTITHGDTHFTNAALSDEGVRFMFGKRAALAINDVQLLNASPDSTKVEALLTGTGFDDAKDEVYVNGTPIDGTGGTMKTRKSRNLYRLTFNPTPDESLKFTVIQDKEVAAKSVANPAALKITDATVLSYDPPANKKSHGIMTVKVEGSGFTPRLVADNDQTWRSAILIYVSPSEEIIKLIDPEPLAIIRLTNPTTHGSARAVVQKPPPKKAEEKNELHLART